MIDLGHDGDLGALWEDMGAGLEALTVWDGPGGPVVFARSGAEGGIVTITFDGAGQPQISGQRYFSSGEWAAAFGAGSGRFEVIDTPTGPVLVYGDSGAGQLVGFAISGTSLGAAVTLDGANASGPEGTLTGQSTNGFVIAAAPDGSLRTFTLDSNGDLTQAGIAFDNGDRYHATPAAMTTVEVDGRHYVLIADRETPGVSNYRIEASGALTPVSHLGTQDNLGMYPLPAEIVTAEVGGETYALVVATSDGSAGASLSVLRVADNGRLFVTDHILDDLDTRFGEATAITAVSHNGWAYVVAAGGDGGVSLFTLSPGGQLVHVETLVSEVAAPLAAIADIEMMVVNDTLQVIATSGQSEVITTLSADLSEQGIVLHGDAAGGLLSGGGDDDLLVGGLVDDTVTGGLGDDILRDGRGEDVLTGGAGRDRFMLDWDGDRDVISDFQAGLDVLDLSLIPMLYSTDQITVTQESWGAFLEFRGEELELRRDGGGTLTAGEVFDTIDWGVDRPPLILSVEIIGTNQDDTLEGTEGDDVMFAQRRDDIVNGYGGHDFIDGGDDEDTVYAGLGNDSVYGGEGSDLIYLEDGNDVAFNAGEVDSDTIFGGAGADTIFAGGGADVLHGDAGADSITGGDGDDTIWGGDQYDTIWGDAGNDVVDAGNGRDLVNLNLGDDRFVDNAQAGEDGRDTVFGGFGNDTLLGGGGDDALYGQWDLDSIEGGLGNDSLYGGEQADTITGGEGDDRVWGGLGRDLIYLDDGNDRFFDEGQDDIWGRDTVWGGDGDDTMDGAGGDDLFYGQSGADVLRGGLGHDTINGGDQFDTIFGDQGEDRIWGGNGSDLIYLGEDDDSFFDEAQNDGFGRDTVFGGFGNDTLDGDGDADLLYGENGDDSVSGGFGNDSLYGGIGADTILGGDGNDSVWGGAGRDYIELGLGNDRFVDEVQNDQFGRDTVFAGGGVDTLEGAGGDDELHGQNGEDLIYGGAGNDRLFGGDQFDTIFGGEGDDSVFGGNGRDVIDLGSGNDTIYDTDQAGEFGQDTLTGGAGADDFVWAFGTGDDVVTDYQVGVDGIVIGTGLAASPQALVDGAVVEAGGLRLSFDTGGSVLLEGVFGTSGLAGDIEFLP